MRGFRSSECSRQFNSFVDHHDIGIGISSRSPFKETKREDDFFNRGTNFWERNEGESSSQGFRSSPRGDTMDTDFNKNSSEVGRYQQSSRSQTYSNQGFHGAAIYNRFDIGEELNGNGSDSRSKQCERDFRSGFGDESNGCRSNGFHGTSSMNNYLKGPESERHFRSGSNFLQSKTSDNDSESRLSVGLGERGTGRSFDFIRSTQFPVARDMDRSVGRTSNELCTKLGGYGRGMQTVRDTGSCRNYAEEGFGTYHSVRSDRYSGIRDSDGEFGSKSGYRESEDSRGISFAHMDDDRTGGFGLDNCRGRSEFSRQGRFSDRDSGGGFFRDNCRNRGKEGSRSTFSDYVPLDRDLEELYQEDKKNAESMVCIDELDLEVRVEGRNVNVKTANLENWDCAGFDGTILENLRRCKYDRPRRIQAAVIPLIMNKYDLLGHAETGGGKTIAFLLPIIDYIIKSGRGGSFSCAPIALIVAPTRELVLQLYDQGRKLAAGTNVMIAKAYGKYNVSANIAELQRGCDVLFATPGRLEDFVNRGKILFNRLEYFVIDEADRMLESSSGFQKQMMDLSRNRSFPQASERHTLMFSATFDDTVLNFAQQLLKEEYVFVTNGRVSAANIHVEQHFLMVTSSASGEKLSILLNLLKGDMEKYEKIRQTLVFVTQQRVTDVVSLFLSHNGIKAISIHGGREQKEREEAINGFRKGDVKVLVSTDVCARGIDIADLDHVVNFDLPTEKLIYVHRIGRTGRLKPGTATSFVNVNSANDIRIIPQIIEVVRGANQTVPKFMLDMTHYSSSYLSAASKEVVGISEGFEKLSCNSETYGSNGTSRSLGTASIAEKAVMKFKDGSGDSDNEGWD